MCKWVFSFLHRRKAMELPPPGVIDGHMPELPSSAHPDMALPLPHVHPDSGQISAPAALLPVASAVAAEPESAPISTEPASTEIEPCTEKNSNNGVSEATEGRIAAHPVETGSPSTAARDKTGTATASQKEPSTDPDDFEAYREDRIRYFSLPEYAYGADGVRPFLAPDLLFRFESESADSGILMFLEKEFGGAGRDRTGA
jgi:hypothetical protein